MSYQPTTATIVGLGAVLWLRIGSGRQLQLNRILFDFALFCICLNLASNVQYVSLIHFRYWFNSGVVQWWEYFAAN